MFSIHAGYSRSVHAIYLARRELLPIEWFIYVFLNVRIYKHILNDLYIWYVIRLDR